MYNKNLKTIIQFNKTENLKYFFHYSYVGLQTTTRGYVLYGNGQISVSDDC